MALSDLKKKKKPELKCVPSHQELPFRFSLERTKTEFEQPFAQN